MDSEEIAHLAGVMDGGGKITVIIGKDEDYPLGYRYSPVVRITRHSSDTAMLGKFDAYAEEQAVQYNLRESGNSIIFEVTNHESIVRFLEPLMPLLVTCYQDAHAMVTRIVPGLKSGQHRDKEGFFELVVLADRVRDLDRPGRSPKHTAEYFEDEWDLPS